MPLTLEQYVSYLDTRNLPWPAAPDVVAPRAKPHLDQLPKIKAVLWNVYGTLLAISGGELLFEHPTAFIMETALDKTIQEFNMWASMSRKPGKPADYLKSVYREVYEDLKVRAGKDPEISSERIWEAIIKKLLQKDYKFDAGFFGALNEYSAKIAYFFHASLQGVGCYAGAAEALQAVNDASLTQGLLGDGQCFTPAQLNHELARQADDLDFDAILPPQLRILSHQVGSRKPAAALFEKALEKLEAHGIGPAEVLHVGSRIAQDIAPAKKLGMRTALFAGDTTSVKATAEQIKNPTTRPDLLMTELTQIREVIPS
jgi:FMN phosphatase YigB (HAD superfamily)